MAVNEGISCFPLAARLVFCGFFDFFNDLLFILSSKTFADGKVTPILSFLGYSYEMD